MKRRPSTIHPQIQNERTDHPRKRKHQDPPIYPGEPEPLGPSFHLISWYALFEQYHTLTISEDTKTRRLVFLQISGMRLNMQHEIPSQNPLTIPMEEFRVAKLHDSFCCISKTSSTQPTNCLVSQGLVQEDSSWGIQWLWTRTEKMSIPRIKGMAWCGPTPEIFRIPQELFQSLKTDSMRHRSR